MDLNFEQMLAQHNQEYKDAEVYNDWMPDDAEYIVSLIKLSKGSSTKDGVDVMWWNLKGRIEDVQDAKLNGKEFTVGYYTSKVFGILKGAVNVLAGVETDDLAEADGILEASIGAVLRVKVRTSRSKKDGKDYTNCYILEVINTTTEASAEDVSNVTNPAPVETHLPEEATYCDPAPVEGQTEVVNAVPAEIPAEAPPVA